MMKDIGYDCCSKINYLVIMMMKNAIIFLNDVNINLFYIILIKHTALERWPCGLME